MAEILYVGSSIFQQWTTAGQVWPGRRVENIAIGGTVTAFWLERLVGDIGRHRPRVLCYYCGSNDFNAGATAAEIIERTCQTFERCWRAEAELHIAYHSIIKAPQKEEKWDQVDEVNRFCKKEMERRPRGDFIDLNPVFFDGKGAARAELYGEDRLHLRPEAYRLMVEGCRPWAATVLPAEG